MLCKSNYITKWYFAYFVVNSKPLLYDLTWLNQNQLDSTKINLTQPKSTWLIPNQLDSTQIILTLPKSTWHNPNQLDSTQIIWLK